MCAKITQNLAKEDVMSTAGRRRGFVSWFVEPYRQVKLGLLFLALNLVFSALIFIVFGYYLWDVYETMSLYFSLSDSQGVEVLDKLKTPAAFGAGLLLVFLGLSVLLSVRYTHRIYGPLVSIHRQLDELLTGRTVEALSLRESDQLQELAEKLNQLAAKLGQIETTPRNNMDNPEQSVS